MHPWLYSLTITAAYFHNCLLEDRSPNSSLFSHPQLQPSSQHQAWHSTRSKHLLGNSPEGTQCSEHPAYRILLSRSVICCLSRDWEGNSKAHHFRLSLDIQWVSQHRAAWADQRESNRRSAPLEQTPWKARQRESCQSQGFGQSLWGTRADGKGQPQQKKKIRFPQS